MRKVKKRKRRIEGKWKRVKEDKWKGEKVEKKISGKVEKKKSPGYYNQYPGDHPVLPFQMRRITNPPKQARCKLI